MRMYKTLTLLLSYSDKAVIMTKKTPKAMISCTMSLIRQITTLNLSALKSPMVTVMIIHLTNQ